MVQRRCLVMVAMVLGGCDKGAAPPALAGTVTVVFGDCAAPGSTFVVGPQPQPVTPERLAALAGKVPQLYETSEGYRSNVLVRYISKRDLENEREKGSWAPDEDATGRMQEHPAAGNEPYTPGKASPLGALEKDVIACFRVQTARSAHVLFDVDRGAIKVHGLDDAKFARCIDKLAAKLPATVTPQRCSAAFGPVAVGDLAGIDIGAQDVTVYGQKVGETPALVASATQPWWRVPALVDAVSSRAQAALAQQAPLTLLGPLVLRPAPGTPMKVVNAVIHSAVNGGGDVVLAARKGAEWKLLSDLPLPFPAVLAGTGGRLSYDPARERYVVLAYEMVELGVLVGKQRTVLGLSRINEFTELPAGDTAALEKALVEHKKSALFTDRVDIQLAGADDATYEQIVELIALVEKVGFFQWTLTSPQGLDAQPR